MNLPGEPRASQSADYQAAVEEARAERERVDDVRLGAVERVMAYARWRAAVQRVKELSSGWADTEPPPAP